MFNQTASQTTRRAFLGAGVATASAFALDRFPKSVFAAYEAGADAASNDVVLRFAAMSDVHFNGEPDAPEVDRLRRALAFMYEYSEKQPYKRFDALLVAGDMSNHGYEKELTLFKKTVDEGLRPETAKIIGLGNHEFISGNKPDWEKLFGPANYRREANGFQFVAIGPEKGTCRDGDYLYALDWFDKEVAAACDADPTGKKPVFTFQHYHVTPTVYGSRGEDNWGIRDLYETLQKYPRVIDFSGHSHYPINDPRSAWQGRFTAFGTGTLSYFEMGGEGGLYDKFPTGYRDAAQFYVVEVRRDNSVTLKPYDLITDSFFDLVYFVGEPGAVEKYVYTDERYKTAATPVWADGAAVKVVESLPFGAVVEFPQASCPDKGIVHSYRVDVEKKTPDGWKAVSENVRYWSEYYFNAAPKTMRIELNDLDEKSEYRATITAFNGFLRSNPAEKLTVEFATTVDETEKVDKNAPTPVANVVDATFDANGPVAGTPKPIQTFGKPKFVADAALAGAFVGVFNGKNDYCRIKFDSRDYSRLGRATLAAKFKTDAYPTDGNEVVFANTESGGVSLEIDKDGKLEFWASVGGAYAIVSAPIPTGEYVDAFGTFDGEAVVLYINGKEAARTTAKGRLTHPKNDAARAFCVGADVQGGGASNYFNGKIARARLFSWALTAEQVANLSKE